MKNERERAVSVLIKEVKAYVNSIANGDIERQKI
jgi:hypothetical protein